MKKLYAITYDTKKGKKQYPHTVYVEAETCKEAKSVFLEFYYSWRDPEYGFFGLPHAYHIEVRLIRDDDVLDFTVLTLSAS